MLFQKTTRENNEVGLERKKAPRGQKVGRTFRLTFNLFSLLVYHGFEIM